MMACLIFHEECMLVPPQVGGSGANQQEDVCSLHGSTCVHCILQLLRDSASATAAAYCTVLLF